MNLIKSYKNLSLLFVLAGGLEEKKQAKSYLNLIGEQVSAKLHITFCTIFLGIQINILFVIQLHIFLMYCIYFLCSTNLLTSHKNHRELHIIFRTKF